jgi:hypothetical protein
MIPFASCYVYSPSGDGVVSERSRLLCNLLKTADAHFIDKYAERVRRQVETREPLADYLGCDSVWVPIPGSAPSTPGHRPVAERLARALVEVGVGRDIWTGLFRRRAIVKSATAIPGKRPTVGAHFDSLAVAIDSPPPSRVMLLDDVVTKGRTLLAAAMRLHDAFPETDIRAFALLRTLGRVQGVEQLVDPCIGIIRWRAGDAHRDP